MVLPGAFGLITFLLLAAAGRKWELKNRHVLPWSFLMGAGVCVAIWAFSGSLQSQSTIVLLSIASLVVAGMLTVGCILFFFFRDPDRTSPGRADWIISPADGTVIYIKEITEAQFPFAVKKGNRIPLSEFTTEDLIADRGIQIGIAMNYLNVHVNRSPIAGKLTMLKKVPGIFASLKHIESLLENERVLMVFENDKLKVGIVQIASRLVRRIVPFVEVGQTLSQGDRVGRITFGSQVDLLLSEQTGMRVCVKVGDEVQAGISKLIELAE